MQTILMKINYKIIIIIFIFAKSLLESKYINMIIPRFHDISQETLRTIV